MQVYIALISGFNKEVSSFVCAQEIYFRKSSLVAQPAEVKNYSVESPPDRLNYLN